MFNFSVFELQRDIVDKKYIVEISYVSVVEEVNTQCRIQKIFSKTRAKLLLSSEDP